MADLTAAYVDRLDHEGVAIVRLAALLNEPPQQSFAPNWSKRQANVYSYESSPGSMGDAVIRSRWIERESRSPRWVEAILLSNDGKELPVIITNISYNGCRIRAGAKLPVGQKVDIEVPRLGRISMEIRWAERGDAGGRFTPYFAPRG